MMTKRILTTMVVMMTMAIPGVTAAGADTLTVRVKGMRCEECAHKVGNVLRKVSGVESLDFNIERRTVCIAYDPSATCADTLRARLAATGRYKASDYSPADTITRGMGLQMADMHCQNCANRIAARFKGMAGIDSLAAHVDKHYVFFRYDANHLSKEDIRRTLCDMGFTPVNYYTGKTIGFAYFNIPAEAATEATRETAMTLDGVDDATVNPKNLALALTYINTETTAEKLLAELQAAGIAATVPPAHECQEEATE